MLEVVRLNDALRLKELLMRQEGFTVAEAEYAAELPLSLAFIRVALRNPRNYRRELRSLRPRRQEA